jgi:ABC-type glycerol-3-phosphate transport system substrate-binding protein
VVSRVTEIKTLEEWADLAAELRAAGYTLRQFQHSAEDPQGFNAWFWLSGRPEVHIVTHDRNVQKAIVKD